MAYFGELPSFRSLWRQSAVFVTVIASCTLLQHNPFDAPHVTAAPAPDIPLGVSGPPDPDSSVSIIALQPMQPAPDGPAQASLGNSHRVDPQAPTAAIALLSNVERLNIRFLGQPSLSAEYSIAGDETLSLPVIGRLDVRGLSLSSLEQLLGREVARMTGRETYVTVDVIDYRELFITGYVARAGAHRWKRGMTVLHAESLAGGIFRPVGANGTTLVTEAERTRARRAGAELARHYTQQARLIAERDGTKFEPPKRLSRLVDEGEAAANISAQEIMLQSRLASFQAQLTSLRRVRDVAAVELQAISSQRQRLHTALASRKAVLKSVQGLKQRGIVNNERVLNDEARILELEERASSFAVSVARLQAAVVGAERDIEVLTLDRKANIETELQRIDREIAQFQIEAESATQTFRNLTGANPIDNEPHQSSAEGILYEIVRNQGNTVRRFQADHATELVPGDMVIVGPRRHVL